MASTINATPTSSGLIQTADSTGVLALQTGGTTAVTIDGSQNVGIGTSSPAYKLDVSVTGGSTVSSAFRSDQSEMYIMLKDSGTTLGNVRLGSISNAMTMFAGGAERMRIDSSGNLLVGTTTASGRLTVTGSGTTGGAWSAYVTNSAPTQTFGVRNDGAIYLGLAAASPYNNTTASAANCVLVNDGFTARSTSALKYKQDIRDLESIDINKFRPVRYKSKCINDDQNKDHFGIVADEVAEAGINELVNYGAEGEVEGFQYERLTVVLLKTIQEQQAIITEQANAITALEARLTALEIK